MDRLHHLAPTASNVETSAAFYNDVLAPLRYRSTYASDELCIWQTSDDRSSGGGSPEILLYVAEGNDRSPHTHGRPGWQHAAFEVDDRDAVNAVHQAVLAGGWQVLHPPQEYPDYAANCHASSYYALFVIDPDGLRLEIAHIPTATP